jgi:hypothetical protein
MRQETAQAMNGPRNSPARHPDNASGSYATGYAVIAGALCLSLLVTFGLVAGPLARLGLALAGQ